MSARSSSSVSNSDAACAKSSSSGGSTFSYSSLSVTVAERCVSSPRSPGDLLGVARDEVADPLLDLLDEPLRAELDDVVALARARVGDDVDDDDVAEARRTAVDRRERGVDLLQRLELLVDDLVGDLDLELRHLELRPVGGLDRPAAPGTRP